MSYCGVCVITHVCTHSIICTDAYVYIYLHTDACIWICIHILCVWLRPPLFVYVHIHAHQFALEYGCHSLILLLCFALIAVIDSDDSRAVYHRTTAQGEEQQVRTLSEGFEVGCVMIGVCVCVHVCVSVWWRVLMCVCLHLHAYALPYSNSIPVLISVLISCCKFCFNFWFFTSVWLNNWAWSLWIWRTSKAHPTPQVNIQCVL